MISIKGLRDGLLVVFDEQPALSQLRELEAKLRTNTHFFRGGRIALDVKAHNLSANDIARIQALFQEYEVTLWAILTQDEATQASLRKAGLPDRLAEVTSPAMAQPDSEGEEQESSNGSGDATDGLLVRKRVRSGQVLRHPGHIVVIGDVNPGAQLIAGGDIIVWGKLQGVAHAGALGDNRSVVCALELTPSLLRIADAARGTLGDQRRNRNKKPEMAVIDKQEINIVAWHDR